MARLITAGAETRNTNTTELNTAPDGLMSGSGTKPTTSGTARIIHTSDSRAWICAPSSTTTSFVAFALPNQVNGRNYFAKCYFRINQLPTNAITILSFLNSGAGNLCAIHLTPGGKLQLWNDRTPAQIGSDSTDTFAINTWYMIELKVMAPSPATSTGVAEARYWLTDSGPAVTIATSSTQAYVSTAAPGSVNVGMVSSSGLTGTTILIDDLEVNDDQGANENTYPGPGHIAFLTVTADSSIGVWTAGAGATTSLFDGVNGSGAGAHGAATGVAPGSATNVSQVKDTTAGTADALDFICDTYTAQGIDASQTIKLIQPIMCMGNDSATDTQGGVQVVSNPAISETTLTLALGVACGSHATNWRWNKGNVAYLPTPTLGTAPVLRIRKLAAAGMHVDHAGILVSYFPSTLTSNVAYDVRITGQVLSFVPRVLYYGN